MAPTPATLAPRHSRCHDGHQYVPCPRNLGVAIGAGAAAGLIVLSLLVFACYYIWERANLRRSESEAAQLMPGKGEAEGEAGSDAGTLKGSVKDKDCDSEISVSTHSITIRVEEYDPPVPTLAYDAPAPAR